MRNMTSAELADRARLGRALCNGAAGIVSGLLVAAPLLIWILSK
jgi:hypothetical protein